MKKSFFTVILTAVIALGSFTAASAQPQTATERGQAVSLSAVVNQIMNDRRYGSDLERMLAVNDVMMEYMMNQSMALQSGAFPSFTSPVGFPQDEIFEIMEAQMERMMQASGFGWSFMDDEWDRMHRHRMQPEQSHPQVELFREIPAGETDV